jgi:exopolyphosphatase
VSVKVGLSTVVAGLKAWAGGGAIEQAAVRWMRERGINILGVCTTFRDTKTLGRKKKKKKGEEGEDKKGKHKREQAWFFLSSDTLSASQLSKRLLDGLEGEGSTLRLERYKKFAYLEKAKRLPEGARARAYKQRNVDASRKEIAPLVKRVLEAGE